MSDQSGIKDGVTVELNGEVVQGGDTEMVDAKQPDPAVWNGDDTPPHDSPEYSDAATAAFLAAEVDEVKGPGGEWDDAARAERGAEPRPDLTADAG